jgi:ABC-2 type transport system ATP-binding protein
MTHHAPSEPPAVYVRSLRKTWPGGIEAVRGIDFDVASGEVFGLLGPNGAGKSTTIGMLSTTVVPTAGVARLAGFDVASEPIGARSISGVVFQDAVVDLALTGRRNLDTHARLWGVNGPARRKHIDELATAFGLTDLLDRTVATYSGGQRRRLEIARALVTRPRALFLDEPTVGLDPRIRHELLDLIAGLRQRDEMTVLLTTHYLDEAERLCDRIGIMHDGSIVALGAPADLLAAVGDEVVELHVTSEGDPAAVLAVLRRNGIAGDDAFVVGNTITVPIREQRNVGAAVSAAVSALQLPTSATTTRPPNLDDVYLRLTGDRIAA